MAEVTKARTGEHVRRLFQILLAAGEGGMPAGEALEALRQQTQLTPHEEGFYESGDSRFEKIVRFATVGPVKAGWLVKDKGIWRVTDAGKAALDSFPDGLAFVSESDRLYRAWDKARKGAPDSEEATINAAIETDASSDDVAITFERAEETAWAELLRYLGAMPPYEFQDLVADLLRAMGFHTLSVAPPGKDGGIDIVAFPDPLGLGSPRLKVQVKRQQQSVDVNGVRAFLSVLGDGDVGLFVTLGGFTSDAKAEALKQEKRRLTLVDASRLFDLWVEHYPRLTEQARRRLPIKPIYFLAPSE